MMSVSTARLRAQLDQVVASNLNLSALLISSDARNAELVKLLVSVRALIESRDAITALAGVQDILANVVGTSEFVIYSLDRVLGAIVIARVLPHRELLDFCDREVLGLLGAYAATAIIAADRRAEWNRLPMSPLSRTVARTFYSSADSTNS